MSFLRDLQLDRFSFWLGFLAGFLFLVFVTRLRPFLLSLAHSIKSHWLNLRAEMQVGIETRHRNDTILRVQNQHLAEALFSLDEILIEPRLLAPPAHFEPGANPAYEDISEKVLPYLPDWPELPALYGAPTFTLIEAMQKGANIALLGEPGFGKSTALAHLAVETARGSTELGSLAGLIPFIFHAGDINLPANSENDPVGPLSETLRNQASPLIAPRIQNFIQNCLENKKALLLVDGLDELSQADAEQVCRYLVDLQKIYPHTRLVVTCDWQTPRLADLHLIPLGIIPWNIQQRKSFIQKWNQLWNIYSNSKTSDAEVDHAIPDEILNNWLLSDSTPLSPLEITVKVWSAYTGDMQGPGPQEAINAYLDRMVAGIPNGRPVLEALASHMIQTMHPVLTSREANSVISLFEPAQNPAVDNIEELEEAASEVPEAAKNTSISSPPSRERIAVPRVLSALIESGVLRSQPGGRMRLAHPALFGYLHDANLQQPGQVESLMQQPDWLLKRLALRNLASHVDLSPWLDTIAPTSANDVLRVGLLHTARWLRDIPEHSPFRNTLLRQLAGNLQNNQCAGELRARSLAALIYSAGSPIGVLFRQLLEDPDADTRSMAALGCGAIQDIKAIVPLEKLMLDQAIKVRRAACLALVAIGTQKALELVATSLIHGDEELRKSAAEALANHPEEGYPVLEEALSMADLLVRRAAVSGLGRIRLPLSAQKWAMELLQKVQLEDSQWVVKNAAEQTLEESFQFDSRIPGNLPPLTQTPWLIAFAGERGIGVAPGKPAWDLLFKALQEGNLEQRLAALHILKRHGRENAITPLYNLYFSEDGEIRDAAYQTLWHLQTAGFLLPPPQKFGIA